MKRTFRVLGWALLLSMLLSVTLVIGAATVVGNLDHAIQINGESIDHLDAVGSLIAIGGVALAFVIVVLVVPLAVLIPLAIVAVALVGVLLVLAGVLAMVFSPLIFAVLVVWLMVRLIRRDSRKARVVGGATITG